MKRKRKKWTRRIVPIILSMALSVSAFSGFYHPVYAEDEIIQEPSSEELPPDQIEITEPEESLTEQENSLDELLPDQTTEAVTEDITEVAIEEAMEAAAEENTEFNSEIHNLDEEPEVVHDEQVDPEDAVIYEEALGFLNDLPNERIVEIFGMNKSEIAAYLRMVWAHPDIVLATTYGIGGSSAYTKMMQRTVLRAMQSAISDTGSLALTHGERYSGPYGYYTTHFHVTVSGNTTDAYCVDPTATTPPTGNYNYFMQEGGAVGTSTYAAASILYQYEYNFANFRSMWNASMDEAGVPDSDRNRFDLDDEQSKYFMIHSLVSDCWHAGAVWDGSSEGAYSISGHQEFKNAFAIMYTKLLLADHPSGYEVYFIQTGSGYQNIIFSNYKPYGKIIVNKQAGYLSIQNAHPDYYNLDGAVYGVYSSVDDANADTNRVTSLTISGGTATTGDMNVGTYYVKEVTAPQGYKLDPEVYTTVVQAGTTTTVTSVDKETLSRISMQKVSDNPGITDGNSYYSLSGAEYQVYTDAACSQGASAYIVDATGSVTGETDAILTTTEDGYSNILYLARDLYYVKEISASSGYRLDPEVYTVDLRSYASDEPYQIRSSEPLLAHPVTLKKVSSNTTVTTNNQMYSLAGAEYQIYTDAACTVPANALTYNAAGEITGTTNALLTTTADGSSNTLYLAKGIYYVKETKASPGYTLDRAVKQVDIRNYTSAEPYEVTSTEKPVGDPAELVLTKTDSEGVTMVRAGADGSAITNFGNATLEGAVFKVSYYDDLYDSNSINGKTPKAVWYIQTQYVSQDNTYVAKLDNEHLVSDYTSSAFYILDNKIEFPLGTVTYEEFKPASGYKNLDEGGVMTHAGGVAEDNMTIMQIRMNGTSASAYVEDHNTNEYTTNADGTRIHVFTTAQDGSEISVQEDIKRADLAFQKLHYVTHQPMANVFFRIISSTGESHIIKTDADGYFTSDGAEISHLTNTNSYDAVYQVEDDSAALALGDCGVWFYGTDDQTEWNAALIDDDKGAFRYDENYILQELPCTANRGMQMLPPVTVSLTRDNRLTFVGSYTNVPEPEIHTLEWDEFFGEGSHTSVVQDGVVSAIHDTVDYQYLTENTTYTFKTILMELDEDGELVGPLLDADGNMIRANTVITTPASETASAQSICGTVDVKLEVVTSSENNTLKDKRFVIFEYLYEGEDQELIEVDTDGNPVPGVTIAEHADPADEDQIGYFLDIHTKILQHDNDSQDAAISDSMLVSDQVSYHGLDPMNEYRLEAVLKIVDSDGNVVGDIVDSDGNPLTAVKYFIPDEVSGTVKVDLPEFDGYQVISNNRILGNIVAYETLYIGRRTLVKHHNPKDQDQTLYVRPRGRIRVYKTGDQVVAATQYASVYGDFHRLSFDQKPLAGTEFEIHSAMDDSLIETIVTDRTGYAESSDLAWGEYYLIETRTRNGLIRSAKPIAVTLECPEHYQGYWYYEKIDVENAVGDTEINVYKQGEILDIENKTYSFGRKPLEGVIFGVYAAEPILDYAGEPVIQNDECIGFIRTGADGKAALRDALVEGKYYYQEIHTLDGYILDETKHEFQLVLGNEELTSFDVNKENPDVNQLYKTKLQLTKRDSKDGHTISGVEFALFNEKDECMGIYVTDEQGRILIDDLPYGRYHFVEQKAAEGYILDSSPQDFTARTDAASMDVTNDRIPDTPKTGDWNPIAPVTVVGILAAMIACILSAIILQQNRQVSGIWNLEYERSEEDEQSEGKEGIDYEQSNYDGTINQRSGGTVFTRSKSDSGGKVLPCGRQKIQTRGRAGGGLL